MPNNTNLKVKHPKPILRIMPIDNQRTITSEAKLSGVLIANRYKTNIILVGFMGSGKTTVGKALAKKIGYSFIDSDAEIEKQEKMTISTIFETKGEVCFRELEANFIEKFDKKSCVLSTGGGMPCFNDNLHSLTQKGHVFYLKVSFETILKRIQNSEIQRPLLDKKMKNLYTKRQEMYQKSPIIIDGEQEIDKIVSEIGRKMKFLEK